MKEKSYNVCHQGDLYVLKADSVSRGEPEWEESEVTYTMRDRNEKGEWEDVQKNQSFRRKKVVAVGEPMEPDSLSLPLNIRETHALFVSKGWL